MDNGEECDGEAGVKAGYFCTSKCELKPFSSTTIFPPNRFGSNPPIVLGEEGFPQLSIEKTAMTDMANAGDTVAYRIVITNNGSLTAYNAVLSDHLPAGLAYKDVEGGMRTWPVGDMEPGKIFVYNYEVLVKKDSRSGRYVNIAEVTADNASPAIDDAYVDVREVIVKAVDNQEELPVTGFSLNEMLMLLVGLVFLGGGSMAVKRVTCNV